MNGPSTEFAPMTHRATNNVTNLPPTPSSSVGSRTQRTQRRTGPTGNTEATGMDRVPPSSVRGLLSPSLPLPARVVLPHSPSQNPVGARVQHAIVLVGRMPDAQLVATMLRQLTPGPLGELAQFAAHSPRAALLALETSNRVMRNIHQTLQARGGEPQPPSAESAQRDAQARATFRSYRAFVMHTGPSIFTYKSVEALHAATARDASADRGSGAVDEQRLAEAASWARHALNLCTEAPAAAAVLAWVHLHRNEEVQAEQVLQLVALRSPHDVTLQVMLGACALRLGRAADAAAALGVAVGLAPLDVTAHTYMGNALAATGEHFRAMGHYIHAAMQTCGAQEAQQNLITMRDYLAQQRR